MNVIMINNNNELSQNFGDNIDYRNNRSDSREKSKNMDDVEDAATARDTLLGESEYIGCSNQLPQMTALMHGAEEFIRKVWERGWGLMQHHQLPAWLKDNNFLIRSHRPQLDSFWNCFRSLFRVHTETVNIWTHLLGWLGFLAIATVVLAQPIQDLPLQDKGVMLCFFIGAILCLGFSWLFHTVYCHSKKVGKIFNKLDYCGIAFLTMGSFIPWLYYSFYCSIIPKIIYVSLILFLGTFTLIVSLFDKFATPPFRPLRAGLFIGLGLSGVIPCVHYTILNGFWNAIRTASVGWLSLMALLYITGAVIYAVRIPERLFPGKFDILFQSHQIFHVAVVVAALVHYYGIMQISSYRLTEGDCTTPVYIIQS